MDETSLGTVDSYYLYVSEDQGGGVAPESYTTLNVTSVNERILSQTPRDILVSPPYLPTWTSLPSRTPPRDTFP